VALYRPGPMAANMHNDYADRKNHRKPIEYFHPDAEEILGDTQGLMIYQESMMRVAQKFAGFSLAEADNLRKAAGKKIREVMAKERNKFEEGCETTGYGRKLGKEIFDIIEPFADYAFNKSHSYGYGFVSYQTAWLKANYPAEYLAALLTSVKDDKDKTAVYLSECRTMNLDVLVPDVNASLSDFSVGGRTIRFGLSAVRNVGEGLVGHIVAERERNGFFTDFYDFCKRVDISVLNKRTVESLIKGGAFDSLGQPAPSRRGLMEVYESIIDNTVARRREEEIGVMSLFGEPEPDGSAGGAFNDSRVVIPTNEWDKMTRLGFEKEMLGLFVSDHPLLGARNLLKKYVDSSIRELRESTETGSTGWGDKGADFKTVAGMITGLQRKYTKAGDLMGVFTLEDLDSSIEVMVFPKTMLECNHVLADDALVAVKARLDTRDDIPKLIAMTVQKLEINLDGGGPPLRLFLPERMDEVRAAALRDILKQYPGDSDVFLHFGRQILRLPDEFRVDPTTQLLSELRVLLGSSAIAG
jgi:DNA polymerase III subunit alpha